MKNMIIMNGKLMARLQRDTLLERFMTTFDHEDSQSIGFNLFGTKEVFQNTVFSLGSLC